MKFNVVLFLSRRKLRAFACLRCYCCAGHHSTPTTTALSAQRRAPRAFYAFDMVAKEWKQSTQQEQQDSQQQATCSSTFQAERQQQQGRLSQERAAFVEQNPDYGYGTSTGDDDTSSLLGLRPAPSASSQAIDSHCRRIDSIRERDFPHLLQPISGTSSTRRQQQQQQLRGGSSATQRQQQAEGLVYLDHAGATLHSASQLREAMEPLFATVHGNPHSQVSSSAMVRATYCFVQ